MSSAWPTASTTWTASASCATWTTWLALEALEAVQWVPGDGQPGAGHWIDVYRRIAAAGKGMWIVGGPKDYLEALDALHGTPYFACSLPESERDFAQTILNAR